MSAAILALLAEVIAGQERAMKRLDDMQEHIDESLIEERVRVETIARLLKDAPPPEGMTLVQGAKATPRRGGNRGPT